MHLITIMCVIITIGQTGAQPVNCIEDKQCMEGFFCHRMSQLCHECLTCERLNRLPPQDNDCIKSGDQCGPCLQGYITNELHRSLMCSAPTSRPKILNLPSYYIYMIATCIAIWFLIIICILEVIWKTHFIKVKISISENNGSTRASVIKESYF